MSDARDPKLDTAGFFDFIASEFGLDTPVPLHGGRTNRLWRNEDVVIKLYRSDAATPLFRNDPQDEWLILKQLRGQGIAPTPHSLSSTPYGDVLIYEHLEGPSGYSDIDEAFELLHRVHLEKPSFTLQHAARGSDVIAHGLSMLPAQHVLHSLTPTPPSAFEPALIHGDPVFTNFVQTQTGLRLIDWQCPAIGDPVHDFAHLVSPAMTDLYGGRTEKRKLQNPPSRLAKQYFENGKAYHWRIACYCAWQIMRGNDDYQPAFEAELEFLTDWD